MAFEPGSGLVRLVGESATWEYAASSSRTQFAAQLVGFELDPDATITAATVTVVTAGNGDDTGNGSPDPGVELLIWSWLAGAWESLGSHTAGPGDLAAARTISAVPTTALADLHSHGPLWLLITPSYGSSPPGSGSVASELTTDSVQVEIDYTL